MDAGTPRRAGISRGGGEHGGRRKEEEAFRCFAERDVKTENKILPGEWTLGLAQNPPQRVELSGGKGAPDPAGAGVRPAYLVRRGARRSSGASANAASRCRSSFL